MAKKSDQSTDEQATPMPDEAAEHLSELTADLQRLQAEFINYKRRAESERSDTIDFAKNRVVREFLVVRDSFDQELAHRPSAVDATWAASIDAIRSQFDKVLTGLGVERFESLGQTFDPHLHEAIMMEDGEGAREVVVEELQAGYKLGSTVLRHAMVKVGRTSDAETAQPAATEPPAPLEAPTPDTTEAPDSASDNQTPGAA